MFDILVVIAGVAMNAASFPQAIKIFRLKSAQDVSLITYLIFFFGGLIWVAYGVKINNFVILAGYIPGILADILVLIGIFKYSKFKK